MSRVCFFFEKVSGDVPCPRTDFVMTSIDGKVVVQVKKLSILLLAIRHHFVSVVSFTERNLAGGQRHRWQFAR